MAVINKSINFIDHLVNTNDNKIELKEFLIAYAENCNKELDLSFMDYLIALADVNLRNKFIISHYKLINYGIISKNIINHVDIRGKLTTLNLIENEDFIVQEKEITNSKNKTNIKKVYMLTPRSFKLCLIRLSRSYELP